jgi:hypothetical protein
MPDITCVLEAGGVRERVASFPTVDNPVSIDSLLICF